MSSGWRAPWVRGLVTGIGAAALGAVLLVGIGASMRPVPGEEPAALASAAARRAGDWLDQCQRATRLLGAQVSVGLDPSTRPEVQREALRAARRAYPDDLVAALLLDGGGSVLTASEEWREGMRPEWLRPGEEPGVSWSAAGESGRVVVREPLVAPPGVVAPLWVITAWDPNVLVSRLEPLASMHPGGTVELVGAGDEGLLRVPILAPAPARARLAEQEIPGRGVRVRAAIPAPPPAPAWPWGVVTAVAVAVALLQAGLSRRRAGQLSELADRLDGVGRRPDLPPLPQSAARGMPEVARAFDGLRERVGKETGRRAALEATLARLRGGVVLVTDATGVVELVAGDPAGLLGRAPAELQGRALRRVLAPEAWEALAPLFARAVVQQGVGNATEIEFRRGSGDTTRLEVTVAARERGEGAVLLLRDVAAERGLQAELELSEERYRGLVDGLRDGVALVEDGRIRVGNPALAGLLGVTEEDLCGRALSRHVAAEDVLVLMERLRRLGPGGDSMEIRLLGADRVSPVTAHVEMRRTAEEGVRLVVIQDRTEQRRAEARLEEARRKLDATLEATSDGVLAVSPDGTILFANGAFAGIAGGSAAELVGRGEREVLHGLVARGVLPAGLVQWSEQVEGRTERFPVGSGSATRVLEVQRSPLLLPGKDAPGRVYSFRDVTAQAEAERRLRLDREQLESRRDTLERANRELERVNADLEERTRELDEVNRRLKRLDEMRSNLLANVSHELQTPLVSIRGYTEMILKRKIGPVTHDQERGLTISLKNIDRLIGLIDNLLEFSRAEGGLSELHLSTFRLKEAVEDTLELLRDNAERQQVALRSSYPGGDPVIRADRDRIGQVLVNLIGNGIKFNVAGGEVHIEVGPPRRGFVRVQVRDTGRGIPAEDLERVFERYYRVQASGAEVEGSGLGLAITRQILRMHGCTIRAESPADGGAVFSFTLPLARDEEDLPPAGEVARRRSATTSR